MNINSNALAEKLQSRDATREPTWVRYTLITIALLFFLSCLILPLILVFVEAFKQGVGVYAQALVHPDTLSAVKLTLLTAVIAVPLNVVFGVAAAWCVAKFNFRGKSILIPQSVIVESLYYIPGFTPGDQVRTRWIFVLIGRHESTFNYI